MSMRHIDFLFERLFERLLETHSQKESARVEQIKRSIGRTRSEHDQALYRQIRCPDSKWKSPERSVAYFSVGDTQLSEFIFIHRSMFMVDERWPD